MSPHPKEILPEPNEASTYHHHHHHWVPMGRNRNKGRELGYLVHLSCCKFTTIENYYLANTTTPAVNTHLLGLAEAAACSRLMPTEWVGDNNDDGWERERERERENNIATRCETSCVHARSAQNFTQWPRISPGLRKTCLTRIFTASISIGQKCTNV